MQRIRRRSGLAGAIGVLCVLVVSAPAQASGPPSPVPNSFAAAATTKPCDTTTADDTAVAAAVRPQMNGKRLGQNINGDEVACARVIVRTVAARHLAPRAAVIAVTTAITESTLHNYTVATDHTSLGLFQQQDSWGTAQQRTDPVVSTGLFLNALASKYPNNSWTTGDIGAICQKIQVSAYPSAYGYEVHDAQLLVDRLWNPTSSQPAIVLTSGGGLQVVARDTGAGLRNVWADKNTGIWTDQGSLTSGVTGDPALAVGSDGNTVAVYRGTDNHLHEQWMDRNTGQWGGVGPITDVVLSGDPVMTAITDQNLQVLARDAGGGLHSLWMDHANGIWHDQGVVAGATDVVGTPAITVGSDGNTAAVYRGTDARLHIVWMDKDTGIWAAAPPVSRNLASDPTLTVNTAGNLQVLVRNTSGQLLDIWMDKTTGVWTDQGAVAANVIGNPATTIGFDGNTVVAYRGSDGRLYESWMDKATGDWGSVGPLTTVSPTGDPALALDAVGNLNIVVVGGHTLYQTWMNTSAQWAGAQALATSIA